MKKPTPEQLEQHRRRQTYARVKLSSAAETRATSSPRQENKPHLRLHCMHMANKSKNPLIWGVVLRSSRQGYFVHSTSFYPTVRQAIAAVLT